MCLVYYTSEFDFWKLNLKILKHWMWKRFWSLNQWNSNLCDILYSSNKCSIDNLSKDSLNTMIGAAIMLRSCRRSLKFPQGPSVTGLKQQTKCLPKRYHLRIFADFCSLQNKHSSVLGYFRNTRKTIKVTFEGFFWNFCL